MGIHDFLSLSQFNKSSLLDLFKATNKIKSLEKSHRYNEFLKNKIIALLFFEPSSRTFSSFSAAVKKLGGQTIEYQNPTQTSSVVKGETLEDTVKIIENYSDAIVMRHYEIDALSRVADAVKIPVINAGNGTAEHPTQALLDLFTLFDQFGRLDNLTGLIAGDLLNGRTVHSLIKGLGMFNKVTLYLLAPKELSLTPKQIQTYASDNIILKPIFSTQEIPKTCDFWYWTRVQKERFKNINEYTKIKNSFILTKKLLEDKGNKNMIVMHPLPRINEIEIDVDNDPRSVYLTKQVKNGLYIRMALLSILFGKL
jgi:aspartate carbamoyltransferase